VVDFQLNLHTESVDQAHPTEPLLVAPEAPLRHVLELLKTDGRGAALICESGGRLVGILTERDIVRFMAAEMDLDVAVKDVMIKRPVTVTRRDSVGRAIQLMSAGGYRRLPIVDDIGRPVGILGAAGILEYLVEHFPQVIYTLPPQPHHTMQEREGA